MPGIIEDPQVVRDALAAFHDLVANDGPRRHFTEYLTGLSVADRMTIGGIHREVAPTTDRSGFFIKSVGTRGKHYLLELRRFCPKGLGACLGDPFEDHTTLFGQLVDGAGAEPIPGAFPFDRSFTHASILNPIQSQLVPSGESRADGGDLKFHRKLEWTGRSLKASEVAAEIPAADRKLVPIGLSTLHARSVTWVMAPVSVVRKDSRSIARPASPMVVRFGSAHSAAGPCPKC